MILPALIRAPAPLMLLMVYNKPVMINPLKPAICHLELFIGATFTSSPLPDDLLWSIYIPQLSARL
jgi:hypothetical protein